MIEGSVELVKRLVPGGTFVPSGVFHNFSVDSQENYSAIMVMQWSVTSNGYAQTSLGIVDGKRKTEKLHRIVWELVNGIIPGNMEIDHVDRVKSNSIFKNLRLTTRTINNANRGKVKFKRGPTTSMFKCVFWNNQKQRWQARIGKDKKQIHLGFYDDECEAAAAANAGYKKHYSIVTSAPNPEVE